MPQHDGFSWLPFWGTEDGEAEPREEGGGLQEHKQGRGASSLGLPELP